MYKVNTSLSKESEEIGRACIFPSGWLENESIWLHMEYKYLLELLRCELYDEFYETMKNILIPFLKPEQYGRSSLENSSFLVSSAHEDKSLHGQGFVSRLSGSTAEFVHIWIMMNVGKQPFICDQNNELCISFKPTLAEWLFTCEKKVITFYERQKGWQTITLPAHSYAFNFLGSILTVYHNPKRKNTYGKNRSRIKEMTLSYINKKQKEKIQNNFVPAKWTKDVLNGKITPNGCLF